MTKQKLFSSTLASLMIIGQFGWITAAAADDATPTPTEAVSPSPSPAASPSPSPEASASPSPDPSPSASPEASPSPSPSPTPKKKSTDKDANGCTDKIPKWVYDVAGKAWVESDQSSFTCDTASGYYLSPKYSYDERIGWYEIMPPEAASTPQPTYMITPPNVVHTVLGDLQVGSQDYQMAQALGLLAPTAGLVESNTGAGSTNQATVDNSGKTWVDLTNLVNVINTLQSNANSGNATATSNTQVGDSTTGAVNVVANLINLLASAWSWSNGNLNFFMQDMFGDHTGDLNLNPTEDATGGGGALGGTAISGTGADSTNGANTNNTNSLDVNAKNTGNIVNNVDVNAQSGDATASKNTSAGNVATGDAVAEVNIVNLINSFINSGSSFFGVLNLFGNLNGDILFPTGFLNGLVPSSSIPTGGTNTGITGTGADSTNQVGVANQNNSTITNTNANSISNNIATNAASGAANLDSNTSAGAASTGNASTTQGLFNLANSSIFGDNAVLVIVNVLGHWVGQIMTLPGTGTTQSALLTGNATVGVNQTGADSTNQATTDNSNNANINQSSVGTITNNVNVNAQSGDATADKNTKVGDVSTGDAKASSSVANIFNTVLNVKHWFGVLVINVFGDWTGDVNRDTAAGNTGAAQNVPNDALTSSTPSLGLLALVTPTGATTYSSNGAATTGGDGVSATPAATGKVLTAAAQNTAQTTAVASAKNMSFMFIISALVMLVAGALLSIEKKLRRTK